MKPSHSPHLNIAKAYWERHLHPLDLAIDATCGNGQDTLFLANLCTVIALDIQDPAIEHTQTLLKTHKKKAFLYQLCHTKIDEIPLPKSPRLIVYNLGYLPGGDKSITTLKESTLQSINKSCNLLDIQGALCITCYPGHEEGFEEEKIIEKWAAELDAKKWSVCHHKWINKSKAPSLFWIVKTSL